MFNLNQSKTYFHPVVFDTIDGAGKKLKIEFDAEFPRLGQDEIKAILDAKPVNTTEETIAAFMQEATDCIKADLAKYTDLGDNAKQAIAQGCATSLIELFGDRIHEKKLVTDEIVSNRVLVGFRKVKDGDVDVTFTDESKTRALNYRGAIGAVAKSWLKSIGIEGIAKN
jgi:hypothetical protein